MSRIEVSIEKPTRCVWDLKHNHVHIIERVALPSEILITQNVSLPYLEYDFHRLAETIQIKKAT